MKKIVITTLILLIFSCIIVIIYYILPQKNPESKYTTDFSRIEKSIISENKIVNKRQEIVDFIKENNKGTKKISIAGTRFSGGGHTFSDEGIVLDMSEFNKIISYEKNKKIIIVESGIKWKEIQKFINKDDLAIGVMQSSNIFSVGGSISTNIHGRDPRLGTIVDSIESFRIITADGELYNVSKKENTDLFYGAIGGFGLLGVITDVTLYLKDNEKYNRTVEKLDYKNYTKYLKEKVIGNNDIGLHFGRLSIVKGKKFLKEFYVTNFNVTNKEIIDIKLIEERWILRNRFFFNISRDFDWAKILRWELQKIFTDNPEKSKLFYRNNAMNPPIKFISYFNKKNTDILQEYFIPIDDFDVFIDSLREKMIKYDINLLNITTRYIPKGNKVLLNYNTKDMIAIVLYLNVGLSDGEQKEVKKYTREAVDLVNNLDGTYYLVYQKYPTKKQLIDSYPNFRKFIELKNKYDTKGLFSNKFYEKYK